MGESVRVCWWLQTVAGWMSVWLSGMNECLRRAIFVKGTLNGLPPLLSISRDWLSQTESSQVSRDVSSDKILLSRSVCRLWQIESNVSCSVSANHSSSLSGSLFQPLPVLLWSIIIQWLSDKTLKIMKHNRRTDVTHLDLSASRLSFLFSISQR